MTNDTLTGVNISKDRLGDAFLLSQAANLGPRGEMSILSEC
jgi:hypothetical protein